MGLREDIEAEKIKIRSIEVEKLIRLNWSPRAQELKTIYDMVQILIRLFPTNVANDDELSIDLKNKFNGLLTALKEYTKHAGNVIRDYQDEKKYRNVIEDAINDQRRAMESIASLLKDTVAPFPVELIGEVIEKAKFVQDEKEKIEQIRKELAGIESEAKSLTRKFTLAASALRACGA